MTSRLVLVFLAACGGAPAVAPKPAPVVVATKPRPVVARIEAGDAHFGCVGWSKIEEAAACVIGMRGTMGTTMALVDTGPSDIQVRVEDPVDNADSLNAQLAAAGYMQFTHEARPLEADTPLVVGGAKLTFTSTDTSSDIENTAPQFETKVTASCGGRDSVVFEHQEEGREYQATVRRIGDRALIELAWSLAREGEYGSGMQAVVVDTKTCEYGLTDIDQLMN